MEDSKIIAPSAVAYSIGLAGTAFMTGSTFSYLAGLVPLIIILAIPGFADWAISYFAYNKIKGSKTERVTPLIDHEYNTIYEICERAVTLLHT